MIKVLLFEDNKNLREGLALYLSATDDIWLIDSFPDARDAVYMAKKHKPDVVLMDIQMPKKSGIEALIDIRNAMPGVKVLIQTVFEDDEKIFQAICSGASGYIVKSPDPEVYVQAIREVYAGGAHMSPAISRRVLAMFQNQFVKSEQTFVGLTNREREILGWMVKGQSYKMIAANCGISFSTVATHVNHIYEKLHVNSAPEAVVKALEMRLV
ncbi:response regulator transcription factor [Dyadobacter sp. CY261]|uniref:response regulator n=1 Tax=Dyadobacter sp. CY261 TaxID=2907203 RepID=UPI001F34F6F6|nr:response regulator transcription factor [Dyadobacter sp. CY261]MCF0069594.1 response regulator transcription factor [Dyadobacter sp. CY261]